MYVYGRNFFGKPNVIKHIEFSWLSCFDGENSLFFIRRVLKEFMHVVIIIWLLLLGCDWRLRIFAVILKWKNVNSMNVYVLIIVFDWNGVCLKSNLYGDFYFLLVTALILHSNLFVHFKGNNICLVLYSSKKIRNASIVGFKSTNSCINQAIVTMNKI